MRSPVLVALECSVTSSAALRFPPSSTSGNLVAKVDHLIIGGAINTFLAALGKAGRQIVRARPAATAREIMDSCAELKNSVLPVESWSTPSAANSPVAGRLGRGRSRPTR